MAGDNIHTYHCICSELALAIFAPLQDLPKRKSDGAAICKVSKSPLLVPGAVVLSGSTTDEDKPVVLKLEDGFEKRYGVRCRRCELQIGYYLDKNQFEDAETGARLDVLYLLPGSLMSTENMESGKDMESEVELVAGPAG